MPIANFDVFCEAFCEQARISPPVLTTGMHGSRAFTVSMRGVSVTIFQLPDDADTAYVGVEMGVVPHALELQVSRALLDANGFARGRNAPVFSLDPDSGEAVLQLAIPLWDADAAHVLSQVDALAAQATATTAAFFNSPER